VLVEAMKSFWNLLDYTFGGVGGGVIGPRLLVWGYLFSSPILCATIASWPLPNT
jgi:hypothetical protein